MLAFGPVPSRRLGHSLGVNNIPPKFCTYSCAYCQLGKTENTQIKRGTFYEPDKILEAAQKKLAGARKKGEAVDYLTIVPDGEPTLDTNLGKVVGLLKQEGIPIAVISNASLLWDAKVRCDLSTADWVSLKIDAIKDEIWTKINRPDYSLKHEDILGGIKTFANEFKGELTTETMLVKGANDNSTELGQIANFIAGLKPSKAYISIPTRPPAEKWATPPLESTVNLAYQIFTEKGIPVEYLIGYEGNEFAFSGDVKADLLAITAVHPMRKDAVREFLSKAGADWSTIDKLIDGGQLIEVSYRGKKFYIRKFARQGAGA